MKKKNLAILLIIPFLIALLGMVTMKITLNLIDNDILSISWDYKDYEAFKISDQKYPLKASGVYDSKYPVSDGNELVWSLQNKNSSDQEEYARIVYENNQYYLLALQSGEVTIMVSNQKKTVFRSMTGIIYETGVIVANPVNQYSQNNIDSTHYYGEYDLQDGKKQLAMIEYEILTVPSDLKGSLKVKEISENITFSLDQETIFIQGDGSAFVRLGYENNALINDVTIQFDIVKDGVNVYSYQDLLACTNDSQDGEIVVLQKSFESLSNTYEMTADGNLKLAGNLPIKKEKNVELFGTYQVDKKTFSFLNEAYRFTTTYNAEYISQWNEFAMKHSSYQPVSDQLYAALHVQKDFYGNGYTLNFHNLTYPYNEISITQDGVQYIVPSLRSDNLFRGPLPFYTLGDPNNMPLITAYGQDNVGLYVDGDHILLNDLNVKNCDFGNNLSNLEYTGTVLEIHGDDILIQNSRFANGKNVVRSFSSLDVIIQNCMISNARNFLLTSGSNEYVKINGSEKAEFILQDGTTISMSIDDFLNKETENVGNDLLTDFLLADFDQADSMKTALLSLQKALNKSNLVEGMYHGSMQLVDCFFYRSGIASIALETLFNGPYLYNNAPSLIGDLFAGVSYEDKPLVPLQPSEISGISYPTKITIQGKTSFYDYKVASSLDLTGLIDENISAVANSIQENIREITIDDIFPLKKSLIELARKNRCLYVADDQEYFNIPIAFYGGGLNLSEVILEDIDCLTEYSSLLNIDLLDQYLKLTAGGTTIQQMQNMILKTVTTVIGFEPFQFIMMKDSGYLFNQTPDVSLLISNLKGE